VIGEDALKFSMLTGNQKDYRRPMARGILNPGEEEAISMLETLIEGIAQKASEPGEVIAATVPAAPIEGDMDVTFHRIVIERCLRRLGYEPKIINEAMGIIYYDNPTVAADEGEIPFTGVAISFGAGMTNLVVSWRAKKLFEISVARGGDWIDARVAEVRNLPVSKVTHVKEKKLDLSTVSPKDPILMALEIYYEELIRYTLENFAEYFRHSNSDIDHDLDIVLAGGSASVPGFVEKFRSVLETVSLPIGVRTVRLSKDPLRAPAAGALIAALSIERKSLTGLSAKQAAPPVNEILASGARIHENGRSGGSATRLAPSVENGSGRPGVDRLGGSPVWRFRWISASGRNRGIGKHSKMTKLPSRLSSRRASFPRAPSM
jgi:hypothetical protein